MHRKIQRPDSSGLPIPHMLHSLPNNGIEIRRGELSVIYAVAGMGKSSLALTLAIQSQVPTLYISADTNSRSQAVRALSVITGRENDDMRDALDNYRPWCVQQLRKAGHIKWVFDSAPTLDDLLDEIHAFVEVWGEPPHFMVVDNATDVVIDGAGDEWGTLRELFRTLKTVGREYQIGVLALHHASDKGKEDTEDYRGHKKSYSICPPRSDMQGKVSQVPALIMSMSSTDGWMAVCPVKNREGWADPSGNRAILLDWEPSRTFIADRSGER